MGSIATGSRIPNPRSTVRPQPDITRSPTAALLTRLTSGRPGTAHAPQPNSLDTTCIMYAPYIMSTCWREGRDGSITISNSVNDLHIAYM